MLPCEAGHASPEALLDPAGHGEAVCDRGVPDRHSRIKMHSLLQRRLSIISQLRSHARGDRYISSIKQFLPRRRPDQDGLIVKGCSGATEGSNSGPACIAAEYADAEVYSGLRRSAPGLGTYIYLIILGIYYY